MRESSRQFDGGEDEYDGGNDDTEIAELEPVPHVPQPDIDISPTLDNWIGNGTRVVFRTGPQRCGHIMRPNITYRPAAEEYISAVDENVGQVTGE